MATQALECKEALDRSFDLGSTEDGQVLATQEDFQASDVRALPLDGSRLSGVKPFGYDSLFCRTNARWCGAISSGLVFSR